jgi:hypothetical protein
MIDIKDNYLEGIGGSFVPDSVGRTDEAIERVRKIGLTVTPHEAALADAALRPILKDNDGNLRSLRTKA